MVEVVRIFLGVTYVPAKLVIQERTAKKVCLFHNKSKLSATLYNCTNWSILHHLDIDECSTSNPCLNEAECFNTPGGYNCTCKPGFVGTHCGKGDDDFQLLS